MLDCFNLSSVDNWKTKQIRVTDRNNVVLLSEIMLFLLTEIMGSPIVIFF
jgi:hypothetical protein